LLAANTAKLKLVELVKPPDVPITVTVDDPGAATLLAIKVSVLEAAVGFGLSKAVTPLGRAESDKETPPLKPFSGVTVIVLAWLPPCGMPRLLGDTERTNFGPALMVSETIVRVVKPPDVPKTVTVAVPVVAVLLAVRFSVLEAVAGFGLNEAVTPVGRPETDKLILPLNPFCGITVIVLAPVAPCAALTLLGDAERVKVGGAAVTVKGTGLLLFMPGATETTKGPEVAPAGMVMVMELLLQELMVTVAPFRITTLLPWADPNPVPEITT